MLLGIAQYHIQRSLVFFRNGDQPADRPADPAVALFLRAAHHPAHSMGIAVHFPGQIFQDLPAGIHFPHLGKFFVIGSPGADHLRVRGFQSGAGFLKGSSQAVLLRGFPLQAFAGFGHSGGKGFPFSTHDLAGGCNLLQTAFHGVEHGGQARLVAQG